MDEEELRALLTKNGVSADKLEAAVAELLGKHEEAVSGLKENRDKLRAENIKYKAAGKEPGKLEEELVDLKGQINELTGAKSKAEKLVERLTKEKATLETELGDKVKTLKSQIHGQALEGQLDKALQDVGIKDAFNLENAKLRLKNSGVIEVQDDETGAVKILAKSKDKEGKEVVSDLQTFMKSWAQTEEGKRLITNKASGSGALGSDGDKGGDAKTRFDELMNKDALSPSEGAELQALGNKLASASQE